jgi:MFS family permease
MTQRAQAATVSKTYDRTTLSVAVVMLVLVAASYVINAMDRQVFSVVLPPIREDFSFSLAQGGFLSTIFTLGIGLAGVPSGYLLDRYPRKVVMLIGIAIYSVFTILTALALGFLDMSLYRAITGIGESMQNAALFSAVGAYFYSRRAMALFGGVMLQSTGSWKLPFYVYGVLGLVFIGIIGFFVTRRFTEQEEPPSVTAASVDERMPERLLNRNLIIGIITAAIVGTSMYGYLGLYPSFLQEELGFTPTQAGFALSMFGLGALMGIPAGYLGDRFPQRWVIIGALVGAIVTGYVLFNLITTPLQHNVLSFLEGMFASGFLFVNVYSLMQRSVKTTIIGRASGAFITSLYVPSALAGYLFAFLVGRFDWGGAAIVQLVLIPLIGIVAMLFLDPSRINTTRSE